MPANTTESSDSQPTEMHPLLQMNWSGLDFEKIATEIAGGYISSQPHHHLPLKILNYTQQTQFEWRWNAQTMLCRGLIVDHQNQIVARPFPKFFSYDQLAGLVPKEPFEAYEKLDGSLGILYQFDGHVQIASRGSFDSTQARRATEIYRRHYRDITLDPSITYLFEIIYPENRIVVDYGDREDLILIAAIETESGNEQPLPDIGFPLVKRYDGLLDFEQLLSIQDDSREGFVVRFQSGRRVKIKFEEYKRLHKLMTGISSKHIWEAVSQGSQMSKLIERVPDEFFSWIKQVEADLLSNFERLETEFRLQFEQTPKFATRREYADYFLTHPNPSIMFAMLDGKPYQSMIWKMLRPSPESPQAAFDDFG